MKVSKIREYIKRTTQGEWYLSEGTSIESNIFARQEDGPPLHVHTVTDASFHDSMFWVLAHYDLPDVLDELEEAREMIRDMLGYATECGRPSVDEEARELLDEVKWLEKNDDMEVG